MKKSVRWVAAIVAVTLSSSSVMAAAAQAPGTPVTQANITDSRAGAATGQQDGLFGSGAAIPLAILAAVLVALGAYEAAKGKPHRVSTPVSP